MESVCKICKENKELGHILSICVGCYENIEKEHEKIYEGDEYDALFEQAVIDMRKTQSRGR